jgi:hypothetical protein
MKKNQKPYHIEARELGVNLQTIQSLKLGHDVHRTLSRMSATAIRSIWDYRAAGLTKDDACALIQKWSHRGYHRFPRGKKQIEAQSTGRILSIKKIANRELIAYRERLAKIMALPDATLDWTCPRVRWEVSGRSIVTVRHNDVTWSANRRHHWPTSSTVSYTSHLIRTTEPGTMELYKPKTYDLLGGATEKKIAHDLRGNWQVRVVKELLNIDWAPEKEISVFFKKVAVCPAFPQSVFASVYDGSPYVIGETRQEKAMKNHNGGLYCYKTAVEAENAPFPDNSTLKNAQKCILSVQVRGKRIRYENGKYAVSEMTPMEVVAQ